MAELCYYCHRPSDNLSPVSACEKCRDLSADVTHASFSRLVPSKSVDDMCAAISKASQDSNSPHRQSTHSYYHSMNEWLSVMDELNEIPDYSAQGDDRDEASFCVRCAIYCLFGLNFMLLWSKAVAMSTSASYTIMSSLMDSCLDIIDGIIISCTAANS
jgi:hypothetical protein